MQWKAIVAQTEAAAKPGSLRRRYLPHIKILLATIADYNAMSFIPAMESGNANKAAKQRLDELLILILQQRERLFALWGRVENLGAATKSSVTSFEAQRDKTVELNTRNQARDKTCAPCN